MRPEPSAVVGTSLLYSSINILGIEELESNGGVKIASDPKQSDLTRNLKRIVLDVIKIALFTTY